MASNAHKRAIYEATMEPIDLVRKKLTEIEMQLQQDKPDWIRLEVLRVQINENIGRAINVKYKEA